MINRRQFLGVIPLVAACRPAAAEEPAVVTVEGQLPARELGVTLMHEHVLVDFVGADRVSRDRYRADDVVRAALPALREAKERGVETLVECTPAYLARDVALLKRLSEEAGLRIVTNTGYYGAADDKFVPAHAYSETADDLAARWTAEARRGIEGTGIRPGFQKIGVDEGPLSEIDRKLIVAAARCHLQTGLTISVHTGDGAAALDILATLGKESVSPSAYVWIHAQNERDRAKHVEAAEAGAWVEFDGLRAETLAAHVEAVTDMIGRGHLGRLLISHDAGWYHVGEPRGGAYRGYTFLFDAFLPALRKRGLGDSQIRELLVENPARALTVAVRTTSSQAARRERAGPGPTARS